jgi:hypothetical protein
MINNEYTNSDSEVDVSSYSLHILSVEKSHPQPYKCSFEGDLEIEIEQAAAHYIVSSLQLIINIGMQQESWIEACLYRRLHQHYIALNGCFAYQENRSTRLSFLFVGIDRWCMEAHMGMKTVRDLRRDFIGVRRRSQMNDQSVSKPCCKNWNVKIEWR